MPQRKSLGDLIAETPKLITTLVKAEIDNLKSEVSTKAKGIGVGGALLAVAGVLALYMIGWLLAAGFEGFKLLVGQAWLAALLVGAALLLVIAILALIGLALIKRNKDFADMEAVSSIKDDVNMVRGLGHAADGSDPLDDLPTTNGAAR